MCEKPKWIYKRGKYKELGANGKGVHEEGESYEIGLYAKCGYCQTCINEKANNWVVRNQFEMTMHKDISWITLTYEENPYILVRKDLQDFMKRLRRWLDYNGYDKVRMFGAGEYGTINNRPHYHVILYGYKPNKKIYLDVNKKGYLNYQDPIIHKIWGLGRTTIDEIGDRVIPYITQYTTAKETFAKAYKLTMEKMKFLRDKNRIRRMKPRARRNLQAQLKGIEKTLKKTKEKYYGVKEFNTWSLALGWEAFYEHFLKNTENYAWEHYFLERSLVTPSPWVKKLANMGYVSAIKELARRQEYIVEHLPEDEERRKNTIKALKRCTKEKLEWKDKKALQEDL